MRERGADGEQLEQGADKDALDGDVLEHQCSFDSRSGKEPTVSAQPTP